MLNIKRTNNFCMRVLNTTLNEHTDLLIELTKIYGIGFTRSKKILLHLEIPFNSKLHNIEEFKKEELRNYLNKKEKTFSSFLKRSVNNNIKKEISLNTYKGNRFKFKMPVRGQRTRSNNKTNKKKLSSLMDV